MDSQNPWKRVRFGSIASLTSRSLDLFETICVGKKKAPSQKPAAPSQAKKPRASRGKSAPAEPKPAPEKKAHIVEDYQQLAEIFGVKVSTLHKWRTAGMPGKKGEYNVDQIRTWATINGKGRRSNEDKTEHELTEEAVRASAIEQIEKARKLGLQANILARKDRIEEGGLLRSVDVNRFITEFLTEARNLLDRMVVEFSAGYGRDLEEDLRVDLGNRKDLLLNQLGDWIENVDDMEILE
ncbi:hypothetical protein OAF96_00505 [bacterium]|nr:hypothetical protein [bacterium]